MKKAIMTNKIMKKIVTALSLVCIPFIQESSLFAFDLHGSFSDHMVLQRDVPIKVFGTGAQGESLRVSLGKDSKNITLDNDGSWLVTLPARTSSAESLKLSVSSQTKTIDLMDVVIGDVWICSGQSNMGWGLKGTRPLPQSYPHSELIRVITGKLIVSPHKACESFMPDPRKSSKGWARANEKTALETSAVSYYMARELVRRTDIPVGLIVVALGGSQIWPWMSPESIAGHPEEAMTRKEAESEQKWATNHALVLKKKGRGKDAERLLYSYSGKTPSALYNGMIYPLLKTPIAGMLWYQGERSQDNPLPYRTLFPAAISGWRKAWGQGDFPFVFIQLPAYFGHGANTKRARGFSLVREAQEMALKLPNTGMAMALDYGNYSDVHPQEKNEVGRRAALQALKLQGHDLVADGPMKSGILLKGSKAFIRFDSSAGGLETRKVLLPKSRGLIGSNDPEAFIVNKERLEGFELCGKGGVFHKAQARIIGKDTVEVSSPKVDNIKHIRYAFHQFPLCNLYNSEGLPARPFRTDDFHVAYGK
ncbi:MAG: hypothetical protein HQL32_02830 [Planctomycetes bacterium]|nr:hypothetical protein [Planctomycetota bacterium]